MLNRDYNNLHENRNYEKRGLDYKPNQKVVFFSKSENKILEWSVVSVDNNKVQLIRDSNNGVKTKLVSIEELGRYNRNGYKTNEQIKWNSKNNKDYQEKGIIYNFEEDMNHQPVACVGVKIDGKLGIKRLSLDKIKFIRFGIGQEIEYKSNTLGKMVKWKINKINRDKAEIIRLDKNTNKFKIKIIDLGELAKFN